MGDKAPEPKTKKLWQSDTVKIAIAGVLTAVGAYITGAITTPELVQAIFGAVIVIFLRKGQGVSIK